MGPPHRGQSEVIGVILLVAVIVTLVFGVGFVALSDLQSQTGDEQRVNIVSNTTASNVTLEHQGGAALDSEDVTLIISDDSEERYTLGNATQEQGADTRRFEPGDRWTRSHTVSGETIRLVVVHDPTNSVLHDETTVVG